MPSTDGPILLFDGVCTLCDRSVQFVIDHDPDAVFRFASLQSTVGRKLLEQCGLTEADIDSVVLVDDGRCHIHSDAALGVARRLTAPWRWLGIARVVPRAVRDSVYRWVARNRYRWFGTRETCRIPTPALRARFLDADELSANAAS